MRTRSSFVAVCAAVLVAATALPASARVPHQTPRRKLEGAVARSLSAPEARGAVAGLYVERGGNPVLRMNADRPMTPASLTKLATTLSALLRFGPTHRFSTSVVSSAPVRGGVVGGDLMLVGGGDPAFVDEAYGRKRFLPAPDDPVPVPVFRSRYATVESLAAAVVRAGVRRVSGRIVVDESIFDTARTQPGWLPSYQKRNSVEVGNLSGLAFNEGLADIDGNTVAPDPALAAGKALGVALAARGVRVGGAVVHGRATKGAARIAEVSSPPLSEIVSYTNRFSVNFPAEVLLKNLGARFGGAGTTAAGVRVVSETLTKAGIPLDGFRLTDGSGLSVHNTITPRTLASIVRHALDDTSPAGEAMRDSLPVAGGPGTLLKRLRGSPAEGNLRGKTGLITHVRTMAGWVTGSDGSTIVYVTMFNDAASAGRMTAPIDLIALALARFPSA